MRTGFGISLQQALTSAKRRLIVAGAVTTAIAPCGAFAAVSSVIANKPVAGIVQVYGGCGPYGHRGPGGYCRTGGQAGGYIPGRSCPRGFHIGPYGRHCLPN